MISTGKIKLEHDQIGQMLYFASIYKLHFIEGELAMTAVPLKRMVGRRRLQ